MKTVFSTSITFLLLMSISCIFQQTAFGQTSKKNPHWEKGICLQFGFSNITSTYDPTPGIPACDEGCGVLEHLPFFGGYIGWDINYAINKNLSIQSGIGLLLNLYRQDSWTGNGDGSNSYHTSIGGMATSLHLPLGLLYQSTKPQIRYKPWMNLGAGLDFMPHYYVIHINSWDVPVSRYTGLRFQSGMGVSIPLKRKTIRLGATFSIALSNYSPFKTHRNPDKSVLRPYLIGLEMVH